MRFLADESCDFRIVTALRRAGHDVRAVIEVDPGASDRAVIQRAGDEGRLLITEDRDFGQLVHSEDLDRGAGVLLIRCPESFRARLPQRLVETIGMHGERLAGQFAVWNPHRLRIRRPDGERPGG